jgi:predicted RNA-binding protein
MQPDTKVTITLGEGVVVMQKTGQSRPIIANILGDERDADGNVTKIWLDRFVHRPSWEVVGWHVSGAVSTVLERI